MARNISTEAVINAIRVAEVVPPSAPATGYVLIFAKTDGKLYIKDDAGNETDLSGADQSRTLIEEASPNGVNVVTFSAITGTYTNLLIEVTGRSTAAATTTDSLSIKMNNDGTATNYRSNYLLVYTNTHANGNGDNGFLGNLPAANSPANSSGSMIIKILDYSETTFNKMVHCRSIARVDASTQYIQQIDSSVEWESNVAITRIDLTLGAGNFVNGSKVRLYGIN